MGNSESTSKIVSSDRLSHLLAEKEIIINGISDALMVLDAKNYKIIDANRAFLDAYHLEPDQVIGKFCHKVTHNLGIPCSQVEPEECCPLEGSVRTGEVFHAEHAHRDSEGRQLYFEITAYPVKDADGEVRRVIHLARDVTTRREAEIALKESAEKIKRFAYSVAHDLKNPSLAVYGLAKLLMERYAHSIDEKSRKHCEHILKGAREIAELAENINLYISTKELPLNLETLDLLDIIRGLREEFSTQLEKQRIKWKAPHSRTVMEADKVSLTRVLRNLVENALKHGGNDLREIEIGYKSTDNDHILCVRDDGIALREADTGRIFDFFERGSRSKEIQGSGLGMAIVREIVEQHGGRVWLESGDIKGTTFCFSLLKIQQSGTHG
jgi:PAS domain S-box-containing protein